MRTGWRKSLMVAACGAMLLLAALPAQAQSDPELNLATEPYRAYNGGNIDHVDLFTGNLSVNVPLVSIPQRGGKLAFNFGLQYNTGPALVWEYCDSSGYYCSYSPGPFANQGEVWQEGVPTEDESSLTAYPNNPGYFLAKVSVDTKDGAVHQMAPTNTGNYLASGVPWQAIDASGFKADLGTGIVTAPDGVQYDISGTDQNNHPTITETDTNGNSITYTDPYSPNYVDTWTDTMGRTVTRASTSDYSNCPALSGQPAVQQAYLWTFPGVSANGGSYVVKQCITSFQVAYYGYWGQYVGGDSETQSLVLPNGTAWEFYYNTAGYGELNKIVLPTGGSISYQWNENGPRVCPIDMFYTDTSGDMAYNFCYGSTVQSRTVDAADGNGTHTWTYSYAGSGPTYTTTVTSPEQNDTVHTFSSLDANSQYETEAQYYQGTGGGRTLLKTVNTAYSYQTPYDAGWYASYWPLYGIALDVQPSSVSTTWAGSSDVSTVSYSYDTSGSFYRPAYDGSNLTYASAGQWTGSLGSRLTASVSHSGGVLRTTTTHYLWQSNSGYRAANILSLPDWIKVTDGGGTERAFTSYLYDQSPSPYGYHGNRTLTYRYTSGSGYLGQSSVYDSNGDVTSTTDAAGHTTNYGYGLAPNCPAGEGFAGSGPTTVTDPMGLETKTCYDPGTGLKDAVIDANNQTTSYAYDNMDRLTQVNFPDTGEATVAYDDTVGQLDVEVKRKMNNNGDWTDRFVNFDGLGRQTSSSIRNGLQSGNIWDRTDTCYNAMGEKSYESYPSQTSSHTGGPTCSGSGDSFAYDALGRLTTTTHSTGGAITRTYSGYAEETTDEGNGSVSVSRIRQKDTLGRLISVCEVTSQTDAAGNVPAACNQNIGATGFLTTYQYDTIGDLTQVTQGGETRSFTYDWLGRLLTASNPENGTIAYAWDSDSTCGNSSAGDLASSTDARGVRSCYSYDADHRVIAKSYSDGTPTATYAYDQTSADGYTLGYTNGRLSSESAGSTAELFSYDQMGRVATDSQCFSANCSSSMYSLIYGHDLAGDETSATNGVGVTIYPAYNQGQQLDGLTSSLNDGSHPGTLATFSPSTDNYNAYGELTNVTLGNGVAESRGYDSRGRTTSIANGSSYSVSIGYAYDGDVTSATDSVNGTWTYGYDAENRLSSSNCTATCPDGLNTQAFSYSYDRYGNRWAQTVTQGTGPSPTTSFNTANRMVGYSYDAAGDLLNDGVHSYGYDAEHRLISVDNGATATYTYNAAGERATKTTGGVTYEYLYGLAGEEVVKLQNGSAVREEVYAAGRRWATYTNGTTYFNYTNWLGTVRVNAQYGGGNQFCQSAPFGDGQGCTGGPSPIHFTGKPRDAETNLDDFGARYYSSQWGHFTTPDWSPSPVPVPYANLTNPQTLNLYAYVGNNPLSATDPNGHSWLGNLFSKFVSGLTSYFGSGAVDEALPSSIPADTSDKDRAQGKWVNPTGHKVRGCDHDGCGYFGAPRNEGLGAKHGGTDYVATPGQNVLAVHAGTITRVGYAYKNDERLNSIDISTQDGYRIGELYVEPGAGIKAGVSVTAGQIIGTAEDIRVRLGYGITPHVHVQIFKGSERINPETLIPAP